MTNRRILISSYYLPQANLDSSSRRLLHIADFLQEAGWEIAAAAKNPTGLDEAGRLLRQRGIAVHQLTGESVDELAAEGFDVALLAFWHVAEPLLKAIRRESPETRVVVDSMDLHFVRQARRLLRPSDDGEPPRPLDGGYAAETVRELNVYAAADVALGVSEKEARLITDLVGTPAFAVPDCEEVPPSDIPFDDRRGIVFVGNFEHSPNADGVKLLCREIVPRLDRRLLARHPVYIVGNRLSATLRSYGQALPHVAMVGWVPSVVPYVERAAVSVAPLLYGAGTKRKLIQALMLGTPTVSTGIGVEGLDLADGENVLVADEPEEFARAITRLTSDRALWEQLAERGREHVLASHGRDASRTRLLEAIDSALQRPVKTMLLGDSEPVPVTRAEYDDVVARIRSLITATVPAGASVAVVSKGDEALLELDSAAASHFPQDENGAYAGYYPADGPSALAQLEEVRRRGARFLVVPWTALWWLDHYAELRAELTTRWGVHACRADTCVVFAFAADEPEAGGIAADAAAPSNGATPLRRRAPMRTKPLASVVIPTHNRDRFLEAALSSLVAQSLVPDDFEVIVVDDGSTDATESVCRRYERRLRLTYERISRSGIAAAKNIGLAAAAAPIVFFFDDDDFADRNLLAEHLSAHHKHPESSVAVLGYTEWAPWLKLTKVMHFATDVGNYLFAYRGLTDGQRLDYTHFWGGRASCKRALLEKHGVFSPAFRFGSEDVELGYRLSRAGLQVVFHRAAVQYMNRSVTYDEFLTRCERQGRSQWIVSRMHRDPSVQTWSRTAGAKELWQQRSAEFAAKVAHARALDRQLERRRPSGTATAEKELFALYWWTFEAARAKGILDAARPARVSATTA